MARSSVSLATHARSPWRARFFTRARVRAGRRSAVARFSSSDDATSSSTTSSTYVPDRFRFVDYYLVLDADPRSSEPELRASWRAVQKRVHPDLAGAGASAASSLVNEAWAVLSHPPSRAAFDRHRRERLGGSLGGPSADALEDDRTLLDPAPLSRWSGPGDADPDASELGVKSKGAFVDESQCVGCLQCALIAPATFQIETRFGKARVVDQWADGRGLVEDAASACPVRCIHFVDRHEELPLLERVAERQWREGGGGGGGARSAASPFDAARAIRRVANERGVARWPARRPSAHAGRDGGVDMAMADDALERAVARRREDDDAETKRTDGRTTPARGALAFADSDLKNAVVPFRSKSGSKTGGGGHEGVSDEASPRRRRRFDDEIARIEALRGGGGPARGGASALGKQSAEFWAPPRDADRREGSFEASDDGGFAPTEWIQTMRRSRGAGGGGAEEEEESSEEEEESEESSSGSSSSSSSDGSPSRRRRAASSSGSVSRKKNDPGHATAGSPSSDYSSSDDAHLSRWAASFALGYAVSRTLLESAGVDYEALANAAGVPEDLRAFGAPAPWLADPAVDAARGLILWTVIARGVVWVGEKAARGVATRAARRAAADSGRRRDGSDERNSPRRERY